MIALRRALAAARAAPEGSRRQPETAVLLTCISLALARASDLAGAGGEHGLHRRRQTDVFGSDSRASSYSTPVHLHGSKAGTSSARDPFDRLLLAQTRVERLNLVSRDPRLKAYESEVLW
jgi:hypothetical protein